ncbi:type IV conjugative transfer system coupling protein TraD [Vibrio coralliilyticus]|uniref:type IV conjugative transfer system coupling protein TraD n=1 Tax=Vibrio TaxID=662 RepID=UPI0005012139|nr:MULTISPECIES: type IV conjugative transfer system coupling protein TraD [Vibrio]KFI12071.1 conjugal transfer protein TraD [Vibrio sp. B183]NOI21177.1 type IV conjugative transfer system coupling protein TraD [Vibrio coralliilyticus]
MSSQHTSNHITRGGQITFHAIHMFFQVHSKLGRYMTYAVAALTLLLTWLRAPDNAGWALFYTARNHLYQGFGMQESTTVTTFWNGQRYVSTLGQQLNNTELSTLYDSVIHQVQINFLIALFAGLALFILATRYFKAQGEKKSEDKHIRGYQLVDPKTMSNDLKKRAKEKKKRGNGNGKLSDFVIDDIALFKQDFEVQHLGIKGTTGAGKSVAIRKLLRWIRKRGDKAIIYDKGCTFVGKFYDPSQDIILNPFDARCADWDIWCDAIDAPDFDNMANALIPQHGEGDPFWVDSARTIFASTGYRMRNDKSGERTTERLLNLMLTSELEEIGSYLKGTEAASLVSDKIQKTAISIKSVLATYIKSLRFLDGLNQIGKDGQPARQKFSITNWIQDENQRGFLFLSSAARQHASLRPLISSWLAIASNAILGLEENPDRRIWVIMDEMPSLHKLPELGEIISEVRKFGGCYVIGLQSYAQLTKTYGKNAAEVIHDLLNTRFYFRSPSNAMAEISSKDLGEQEIELSKENISYGANELRDGVSLGHETRTQRIVIPSELQALDDLECYLRVPGSSYITKLDLIYDQMRNIAEPFIKREFTPSPGMLEAYEKAVYLETVVPGMALPESEQNALRAIQASQFESEDEMKIEASQMNAALKGNTIHQLKKHAQRSEPESTTQPAAPSSGREEAQRQLEEAAIAQHTDIGELAD